MAFEEIVLLCNHTLTEKATMVWYNGGTDNDGVGTWTLNV